ncbi:MAG: glycosyltransferase family 2 protein [Pseudomonadota bacterium]
MTRISVITATWNLIEAGRGETVRQAINSVAGQTHDDVEHIIQDGASGDGTPALLADILSEHPNAQLHSEPDKGIYHGMNAGAARATGDYLLFLNSDDFYHDPAGLAALARAADKAGRPDVLLAPVRMLYDGGKVGQRATRPALMKSLRHMSVDHPGMAVRREVFENLGGFDTRFRLGADYHMLLRLVLMGARFAHAPRPFASFRAGGVSADLAANAADRLAIWCDLYAQFATPDPVAWQAAMDRKTAPQDVLKSIVERSDSALARACARKTLRRDAIRSIFGK